MREDGGAEEWSEGISCDACKADCFAESYLCGEEDICPECYPKPDGAYPADAERQRAGVALTAEQKQGAEWAALVGWRVGTRLPGAGYCEGSVTSVSGAGAAAS